MCCTQYNFRRLLLHLIYFVLPLQCPKYFNYGEVYPCTLAHEAGPITHKINSSDKM